MTEKAPPLTMLEFTPDDHATAETIARRLGYLQTAYTSSSALWGLFCLKENPGQTFGQYPPRVHRAPYAAGCIVRTLEFGLIFVQDLEDLNMHDLHDAETARRTTTRRRGTRQ